MADSLDFIAYARIKEMIVSGDLAPGLLLSENELAGRFGVSRTPVHTAIARLAEEGLVSAMPKRGFTVKEPTESEFFDMHEAIVSMEHYALERLKSDPGRLDVGELRAIVDRQARARDDGDLVSYYEIRFMFSRVILGALGNEAMLGVLDSFRAKLTCKVINYRKSRPGERPWLSLRSHEAVLRALEGGDLGLAQREMLASLDHVWEFIASRAARPSLTPRPYSARGYP